VQATYASQTLAEQSLETTLGALPRRPPASVGPDAPLQQALSMMHEQRIGSVLVTNAQGGALGILTRHDVLGRVTLPQLPLSTSIRTVMTTPVHTLSTRQTALDAALLMSRRGIRHVPVTDDGRVVSIISERDLFALQRLSLKHVSTAIRSARDLESLRTQSAAIRRFARNLLGQGVHARQLTELISHLNDIVAERLVEMVASQQGLDLRRACWLAFGSEGRGEQTIATDQDNGLVFESDDAARDRPAWLAFASEVNAGLDQCGYPLCKGNVMASNPDCCLTPAEWMARFEHWMEHGAPEDLLSASIYFDLRAVAGRADLAAPLRDSITQRAAALPRFLKQLALNALTRRPPLNWRGALDARELDGRRLIDLKLQGTAIFVDAARLYALAHGVAETTTRGRLTGVAKSIGIDPREGEAWVSAFEYLQSLRLQVQLASWEARAGPSATQDNANLIDIGTLNEIDRRMLKESMRIAQRLQQRMEMDYQR
jgi:CBS domain-containing protein